MSRLKSGSGPHEEGATTGGQTETGWGQRSPLGLLFLLTSCRQLSISASRKYVSSCLTGEIYSPVKLRMGNICLENKKIF